MLSTYFTEGRTDLPREAIGPDGSNCFSRGVHTSTSKECIALCDFSVGSGPPVPQSPSSGFRYDYAYFFMSIFENRHIIFFLAA